MKRKKILLATTAAVLALGIGAFSAAPLFAQGSGGYGNGMMNGQGMMGGQRCGQGMMGGQRYGQGMMGGQRYGQGMMGGQRYGQGMMGGLGYGMMNSGQGPCTQMQQSDVDRNIGIDDVRAFVEKNLERRGNDRLKVDKVEASGENTIVAEIVTVDGSLVRKLEFNTKTGGHRPIN
jgi:hypothetical protein